jgi:hypothetical protein
VCAWAFPLIAWNFSSQKSLSLFLAWPLPLTSPTFFYWIWLAPAKKNWNYESSQKLKILWIDGMPPLWPTDIYEKGRTLSKTYGIKARCDWEHPWGTHWEPIGTNEKWTKSSSFPAPPPPQNLKRNTLGTYWNKGKMKKNLPLSLPSTPPPPSRHLECRLSLPIGCMKLLFPKLFGTGFNLD